MENKKENANMIIVLAKAQMMSYIITAGMFIICAVLLAYTDADENIVPVFSMLCTCLSSFASGCMVSAKADRRGIVWGMLSGLAYALVLVAVIYMAAENTGFDAGKLITLLTAVISGALGGIIGINNKK